MHCIMMCTERVSQIVGIFLKSMLSGRRQWDLGGGANPPVCCTTADCAESLTIPCETCPGSPKILMVVISSCHALRVCLADNVGHDLSRYHAMRLQQCQNLNQNKCYEPR